MEPSRLSHKNTALLLLLLLLILNFLKLIYHSISTAQLRIRTNREASQRLRRDGAAEKTRSDSRDICIEDDF